MNMTVNGETYFMPNESEVFLNLQLSAFFIVAAHKSKLFVLRAYLKDIEADTIHFKEIGSIDRRLYYAVYITTKAVLVTELAYTLWEDSTNRRCSSTRRPIGSTPTPEQYHAYQT